MSVALPAHEIRNRHFAEGHCLIARFAPERTVTTYSFSKRLGLAGPRVGAVVATHETIGLAAAAANALGSLVLAQYAAIAGLAPLPLPLPQGPLAGG